METRAGLLCTILGCYGREVKTRASTVAVGLFLVLQFCGCVSPPPKVQVVTVDSLARADSGRFRTFSMIHAVTNPRPDSLEFAQMSSEVRTILEARGLTFFVPTGNSDPDLIVGLSWHPPIPYSFDIAGTRAVYGQTSSGSTTTHNATSVVNGKVVPTTVTSTTPATYGVVGVVPTSSKYTLVRGGISLVALEGGPIAASLAKDPDLSKIPLKEVWKIGVWQVRELGKDAAMEPLLDYPKFLRAGAEFIGRSSNGKKDIPLAISQPDRGS